MAALQPTTPTPENAAIIKQVNEAYKDKKREIVVWINWTGYRLTKARVRVIDAYEAVKRIKDKVTPHVVIQVSILQVLKTRGSKGRVPMPGNEGGVLYSKIKKQLTL